MGKIVDKKQVLATDLTAYIKEKHTQEECSGFIDGYEAAFKHFKESINKYYGNI